MGDIKDSTHSLIAMAATADNSFIQFVKKIQKDKPQDLIQIFDRKVKK